jgi:hypothetical protein
MDLLNKWFREFHAELLILRNECALASLVNSEVGQHITVHKTLKGKKLEARFKELNTKADIDLFT